VPKFNVKQPTITAIQYTGNNIDNINKTFQDPNHEFMQGEQQGIDVPTVDGVMTAHVDNWICRNEKGVYFVCDDDIFQDTYVLVGE